MNLERLQQNFAMMPDWQDRYRFIIEMGKKIPVLQDDERTDQTKVHGCMSNVHMKLGVGEGQPPVVVFTADSDSTIVNGLIAILHVIYDGKTADEIAAVDVESIFQELGLSKHISPIRRNGFFAMVERLRSLSQTVKKS